MLFCWADPSWPTTANWPEIESLMLSMQGLCFRLWILCLGFKLQNVPGLLVLNKALGSDSVGIVGLMVDPLPHSPLSTSNPEGTRYPLKAECFRCSYEQPHLFT